MNHAHIHRRYRVQRKNRFQSKNIAEHQMIHLKGKLSYVISWPKTWPDGTHASILLVTKLTQTEYLRPLNFVSRQS